MAATDINSNGVPHFGDATDQDFALVCYNCALVPDFALSVPTTSLDVCAPPRLGYGQSDPGVAETLHTESGVTVGVHAVGQ